jgi:hypothetical protein
MMWRKGGGMNKPKEFWILNSSISELKPLHTKLYVHVIEKVAYDNAIKSVEAHEKMNRRLANHNSDYKIKYEKAIEKLKHAYKYLNPEGGMSIGIEKTLKELGEL